MPTNSPTEMPTNTPTEIPTNAPTEMPTNAPTEMPTNAPTEMPTNAPTEMPTNAPTEMPTNAPTEMPTNAPTEIPTNAPTEIPTNAPTEMPTNTPTEMPTNTPTEMPTNAPTEMPTNAPTEMPTNSPTEMPTNTPTEIPTNAPTEMPTNAPTEMPTNAPTEMPTNAPTEMPTNAPTEMPTNVPTEMPTNVPTEMPTNAPTEMPTNTPTAMPTNAPTEMPTNAPTEMPTPNPTVGQCGPYTNNIEDLEFLGVGSNCRAGLDISYPGGLSCDSPYIVCLPEENTPAKFGYENYYSSSHRYTVDECLQECANDQRCLGIEFVADESSALGDCNLIDDIPLEITSAVVGFTYEAGFPYTNLDNTTTNGNALCFEKTDECYPYFEASDLNEVMLNCYCPNNRKGFYTKKVKRTVANTRFCGSDTDIDERIEKAQANRMFHLCENWCLFQTENPEEEYWFWDPWNACWREQYASTSYCTRVIEDPDTIEMQFINNRKDHFCPLAL